MQMLQLVAPDVLACAGADHQQLCRWHPPAALARQQNLRQHSAQRHRQFLANRILALQRQTVRNPRNGCGDIHGVQRGQHQMPGLRRSHRDHHRFRVAHLPDYDHVWRLAQGRPQCGGKVRRIFANFHLLDNAFEMAMLILHRVFNDQNVPRLVAIDFVHQRRHGR